METNDIEKLREHELQLSTEIQHLENELTEKRSSLDLCKENMRELSDEVG